MNLIYYPNDFLDKKVKDIDIDNIDFDPKELKQNMVDIMLANNGIGLAANQVEFDGQVFVMGDKESNSTIHINPVILQHTAEKVLDTEGCLSFPGIYVKVSRPKEILAEWYDENLEKKQAKITGYTAKCFLHEYDHLQGITFKDRVSKLKWNMAEKKLQKVRRAI